MAYFFYIYTLKLGLAEVEAEAGACWGLAGACWGLAEVEAEAGACWGLLKSKLKLGLAGAC